MLDRSQQASRYRPLEEVRRTLRVKWYRSPIDPKELRALMQRSDGKGLFQTLGVLALLTASGVITYYFFPADVGRVRHRLRPMCRSRSP